MPRDTKSYNKKEYESECTKLGSMDMHGSKFVPDKRKLDNFALQQDKYREQLYKDKIRFLRFIVC